MDAAFEVNDRKTMKKPNFLSGDKIKLLEDCLFDGNYKWFRQVQERYMFLSNMERLYSLPYLQVTFSVQKNDLALDKAIGQSSSWRLQIQLSLLHQNQQTHHQCIVELTEKEYHVDETPKIASTFLNRFVTVHSEFPCQHF